MAKSKKRGSALSGEALEKIVDHMDELALVLDKKGRLCWFNRRVKLLLGWKRGRVVGKKIAKLPPFHEVDFPLGQEEHTPLCLTLNSGVIRCFRVAMVPFQRGRQLMLLSEHGQQMHQEIRQREFVANASHELRTPLTILGGYLEQLLAEEGGGAWQRPLEVMRLQSERMRQIVEDMLLLSGLEQPGERSHQQVIDVGKILRELVESHSILLKRRNQQLHLKIDGQLRIRGVEEIIISAFTNLLVNAIKYTQKGGEITLSWQRVGEQAEMVVADNGPGIPYADQRRLTERFYRVDKGRSRALGGTGLGLSIVQGALQAHGATLVIESEPGRGSHFSAQFPALLTVRGGEEVE